jgi:hypothetical protein
MIRDRLSRLLEIGNRLLVLRNELTTLPSVIFPSTLFRVLTTSPTICLNESLKTILRGISRHRQTESSPESTRFKHTSSDMRPNGSTERHASSTIGEDCSDQVNHHGPIPGINRQNQHPLSGNSHHTMTTTSQLLAPISKIYRTMQTLNLVDNLSDTPINSATMVRHIARNQSKAGGKAEVKDPFPETRGINTRAVVDREKPSPSLAVPPPSKSNSTIRDTIHLSSEAIGAETSAGTSTAQQKIIDTSISFPHRPKKSDNRATTGMRMTNTPARLADVLAANLQTNNPVLEKTDRNLNLASTTGKLKEPSGSAPTMMTGQINRIDLQRLLDTIADELEFDLIRIYGSSG